MSDASSSQTQDPRTPRSSRADGPRSLVAEILFHSDLRRVGDRVVLGPADVATEVMIGRDTSFGAPLGDPCISRRQLTVNWDPRQQIFTARGESGAKRSVDLFSVDGARRPEGAEELVITIGDRVALLLGCRAIADDDNYGMIGTSDPIIAVRSEIRALALADDTVLIQGEPGVGKELVARALHDAGPRRNGPFVAINCAAITEALAESELFGHVRGAFSGAVGARDGAFQSARKGTLFLDEIGELSLALQPKLLRALQARAVRPAGGSEEISVDVRVVCATNRLLATRVAAGEFREDLFSRIERPIIVVPPLRARPTDVPMLFATFLLERARSRASDRDWIQTIAQTADTNPPAIPMSHVLELMRMPWPRNVRELEKHVATIDAASRAAGRFAAPDGPRPERESRGAPGVERTRPSRDELLQHLEAHDYEQRSAAAALGVSRTTLDRWLQEAGIRRPRDLAKADVHAALRAANADVARAARSLCVSIRGLRLRMAELGIESGGG